MYMPPPEDDPTVVRTRKTVEIIQGAGLETEFDNLVLLFTNGDMLGFIAGCRLMIEGNPDHEIRSAILHHAVGTAFVVGGNYALHRQKEEEAFATYFREMTALPLNHSAVMAMVARHRAQSQA